MAITRHQKNNSPNEDPHPNENPQETEAQTGELLKNPTHKENWPPNPRTATAFRAWMEQNTIILNTWLKEAKQRANDEDTQTRIDEFDQAAKEEWQRYEPETDVQTGTIWNDDDRKECEDFMRIRSHDRGTMHAKENTASRVKDYCLAQAAWEDFLYYQNVWNRRDPSQRIPEYKAEETEKRKKNKPEDQNLDMVYHFWLENIIEQFRKFELGYRKKAPDTIPMSEAHRYSQAPRGTKSKATIFHERRYRHIQERFPGRKSQDPAVQEREEGFNFSQASQEAHMLEGEESNEEDGAIGRKKGDEEDGSVPIDWSIVEGSIKVHMRAKKVNQSNGRNERNYIHHACLEKSSDLQTSFESPSWGNTISITAMLVARVGDKISIPAGQQDPDGVVHAEDLEYEVKASEHLGRNASRLRYENTLEKVPVQVLKVKRTKVGNIKLDAKKMKVDWVDDTTERLVFKTKSGGSERIAKTPEKGQRTFYQTIVSEGPRYATRQSRLKGKKRLNELSDASDGEDDNDGDEGGGTGESDSPGGTQKDDPYGGDKFWRAYQEA